MMLQIKKTIFLSLLFLVNLSIGQEKTIRYLDDFKHSEIPEIPKAAFKNSSLTDLKKEIYNYRKESTGIDSINYKYQIGIKNDRGLWFNSFTSSRFDHYQICERFGNDIHGNPYDFNQVVYYAYNTSLTAVNNEYSLKYKEKIYSFLTETTIAHYANGKIKMITSKADLFGEINAGKWQFFNEKGKLQKEIDFDKHFRLNFMDVFNLLKDKIAASDRTPYFERSFNKKEAYWICHLEGADFKEYTIVINDKTKEMIFENDRKKLERYYFRDFENKLVEDLLNSYYAVENN